MAPTTGNLEVTTVTSGPEPDADGYAVTIDAGAEAGIALNGTHRRSDLEAGNHSVRLVDLALNCTVAGDNPRNVSVSTGATAIVSFTITCGPTTGNLRVRASTSGPSPDADGYTVALNGSERGSLAATAELTLDGLAPGDHRIGLTGVAANCQVRGGNPKVITLIAGTIATVDFAVVCVAPPPNAGALSITATTTGSDLDADGYLFAVDGGATQSVGVNATVTLHNVVAGNRSVRLYGIAGNCLVETNPITVAVTGGGTTTAAFVITCVQSGNSYQLTELDFGAAKINNLGHIAGGKDHAVIWRDGVLTDLGTLGGTRSGASGLNNHGAVVGFSTTAAGEVHGFLWDGTMHDLGADFIPSHINDAGQMIGVTAGGQAVFYSGGTSTPMACSAGGLNNRGQVVGKWHNPPPNTAFREESACLWEAGVVRELVSEPDPDLEVDEVYSVGLDINDQGMAVGAWGYLDYSTTHGFIWRDAVWSSLPSLGNGFTYAYAVNEAGMVVGESNAEHDPEPVNDQTYPVVWRDGSVTKLAEEYGSARDINDRGQILGIIWRGNSGHHVLWTPSGMSGQPGSQVSR